MSGNPQPSLSDIASRAQALDQRESKPVMQPRRAAILFPPMAPLLQTTLLVDSTVAQALDREAKVTRHPVEEGSDVTDNVRPLPRKLSLSGLVTTAPLDWDGRVVPDAHRSTPPDSSRPASALQLMEMAIETAALLEVHIGSERYKNLAIASAKFPRHPGTGRDLYFELDLEEVLFATAKTTRVPASAIKSPTVAKQVSPRKSRGMRTGRKPTATEARAKQRVAGATASQTAAHRAAIARQALSSLLAQWTGL